MKFKTKTRTDIGIALVNDWGIDTALDDVMLKKKYQRHYPWSEEDLLEIIRDECRYFAKTHNGVRADIFNENINERIYLYCVYSDKPPKISSSGEEIYEGFLLSESGCFNYGSEKNPIYEWISYKKISAMNFGEIYMKNSCIYFDGRGSKDLQLAYLPKPVASNEYVNLFQAIREYCRNTYLMYHF